MQHIETSNYASFTNKTDVFIAVGPCENIDKRAGQPLAETLVGCLLSSENERHLPFCLTHSFTVILSTLFVENRIFDRFDGCVELREANKRLLILAVRLTCGQAACC